jgi:ubiquinone/menaquinone biosynthesis C-methylase UbiE
MALIIPHKFRFLPGNFKNQEFNLLDVGAGSHSATKTQSIFPNCNYYGIDITKEYENDENDFKAMKGFYQMDLTKLQFDEISDSFFDVIIMSHIIEHLFNGDLVIEGLVKKLKKGGKIYIEYPGEKSTKLPSMKRTLNFYDDPTHVRIYSVPEISKVLENNNFTILKKGTRRYWPYIVLLPITIVTEFIKYKFIPGGVFWDLMGFAEYLYAEKK